MKQHLPDPKVAMIEAKRNAYSFLLSLRAGDLVDLGMEDGSGRTMRMSVLSEARRADEPYGSWESTRVVVTQGPGRYSTTVTVDQLAGSLGWNKRTLALVPASETKQPTGPRSEDSEGSGG